MSEEVREAGEVPELYELRIYLRQTDQLFTLSR